MNPPADRPASPDSDILRSSAWTRDLLLLVLVFGVLFGFRLGSYPLGNPDEGRYAEIPREMVAAHDYVTPKLDGVNYFEKPPLVYWLVAGCLRAFGPSEWSMRATPALFALAGVLLTYAAGRRLYSREAGLASAVVLGTSVLFFALGHILLLDMVVSVLMAATLFCFILGVNTPSGARRRWFFYGLYATAALATLAKGLIGVLVTGAVMASWLLVFNQWKKLRPFYLPTGALLFLAIALPWHILAAERNPTWVHRYFVYEHWQRFSSSVASRPGPWHYYIWIVIGGLLPWTGFLWPAVESKVRAGWTAARTTHATWWFLATWAAFIFLFFSKSHSKLPPYILPIFPALAVIVGAWLAEVRTQPNAAARLRLGLRVACGASVVLAGALIVVVARPTLARLAPDAADALRAPAIAMAAILLAGGAATPWLLNRRSPTAALTGMAGTFAVFFLALQTSSAPAVAKPGTKALALQVANTARPGDEVLHYHEFFHDFTFYAERTVEIVNYKGELELEEDPAAAASGRFFDEAEFRRRWIGPHRLFVVARKKDVPPLFADSSFHYHLLGETPDHLLFSNQP